MEQMKHHNSNINNLKSFLTYLGSLLTADNEWDGVTCGIIKCIGHMATERPYIISSDILNSEGPVAILQENTHPSPDFWASVDPPEGQRGARGETHKMDDTSWFHQLSVTDTDSHIGDRLCW